MIHVTARRDERWRKLPADVLIASHYPNPGVPRERWVQNVSCGWYSTPTAMAEAIKAGLRSPDGPVLVMIDEVKGSTAPFVAEVARQLGDCRGRFGAYLVNGAHVSYGNLQPAIDALLRKDAVIACEVYLIEKDHPTDVTIMRAMRGTPLLKRVSWLVARRATLSSKSRIIGLMGITPKYLSTPGFAKRVSACWAKATGTRMGAWKWDDGTTASPEWSVWK